MTVAPNVARQFSKLDPPVLKRIAQAIDELAASPFPNGSSIVGLHGYSAPTLYRRRVGDWRIVFSRDDVARQVTLVWVGHRKRAY